jgi:AcrR family transcriptional regulator
LQYTKESVRAKILAAAELEFDEQGYAGASMRSIVRRAETSLGNIYRYYPNKEALFLSIVEPVLDRCIDQTGSLFTVTLSEVERNVPLMVDFVAEHSRVFRIVQNGPPEHYAAFLDRFTHRVAGALESYALAHCPGCAAEPMFFFAAAQSCVGVLRLTLEHCEDREKTLRCLRQLLRFQFGCFEERMALIEKN